MLGKLTSTIVNCSLTCSFHFLSASTCLLSTGSTDTCCVSFKWLQPVETKAYCVHAVCGGQTGPDDLECRKTAVTVL